MEEMESKQSVFRYTAENPITDPIIVNQQTTFKELGYEIVKSIGTEVVYPIKDFYQRVHKHVVDEKKSVFGEEIVDDENRSMLPQPDFIPLEKEGNHFVAIRYAGGTTLIVNNLVQKVRMGALNIMEAVTLQHVMVDGEDGNMIDLMSLRPNKNCRNLFSFSGRGSGFSPSRVYSYKGGTINQEFGDDAYLCMETTVNPQTGKLEWDLEGFKYLFLHENAHAGLYQYEQRNPVTKAGTERNANAMLLTIVREVKKMYSKSNFLDPKKAKEWIEKQLESGYGARGLHEHKSYQSALKEFKGVAPTKTRNDLRRNLLKLKDE